MIYSIFLFIYLFILTVLTLRWWLFSYMFQDQEQLRLVTESVLISLVVQCSNHSPREEFLLFAIKSLCNVDYINWDTLLPSLLSAVSTAEMSLGQGSQATAAVTSTNISQPGMLSSTTPGVTG